MYTGIKQKSYNMTYLFFPSSGAAAVSCSQCRGTWFQIPRLGVTLRGTAHWQSVDTIRVAITCAWIVMVSTVSRRPQEYIAFAISALHIIMLN